MRRVGQHHLAARVLLDLGALHEEARDAHQVGVGRVEREVLVADGERRLDDVEDGIGIPLGRGLDGEDVGDAGVEVLVQARGLADVVVEDLGLVAHLDAHARCDAHLVAKAGLRVQGEAPDRGLGVHRVKAVDQVVDLRADVVGQGVGLGVGAVGAPVVQVQQGGHALAHAGKAEHGHEAVAVHEAVGDEPIRVEEPGLLDLEPDALVDVVAQLERRLGQDVVHKVVDARRKLGHAGQQQAVEAIGAAAVGQHVIAAHDLVVALVGVLVDGVVGKRGIGAPHGAADGLACVVIGGHARLVLHREVGHGVLDLGLDLEQQVAGAGLLRADVGVAVAGGHRAVDVGEEARELGLCLLVGDAREEGVDHAVELTHRDRAARDRRHVVVDHRKAPEQVVEVLGGIELEEPGAVLDEALVVGQDVARPVGRVALAHVVECVVLEEVVEALGGLDGAHAVLGTLGQVQLLLLVGELPRGDDAHHVFGRGHGLLLLSRALRRVRLKLVSELRVEPPQARTVDDDAATGAAGAGHPSASPRCRAGPRRSWRPGARC